MKRTILVTALLAAMASGSAFAQCDPITGHCGGATEEPGFTGDTGNGSEEIPNIKVEVPTVKLPTVVTPDGSYSYKGNVEGGEFLDPIKHYRAYAATLAGIRRANANVSAEVSGIRIKVRDLLKAVNNYQSSK